MPYKPADTFAFSEAHGSQSLPLQKSKKGERHFPFVTYFGKKCFLIRRKFIPGTCVSTNLAGFSLRGEGRTRNKKMQFIQKESSSRCGIHRQSLDSGGCSARWYGVVTYSSSLKRCTTWYIWYISLKNSKNLLSYIHMQYMKY